jgi:hypothetical protein
MSEQFADLMEPVARRLLGKLNAEMSNKNELRFGSKGSLSIDLRKGTYYDHEAGEGGGVLDLIKRKTRGADPYEWMRAQRLIEDAIFDYRDENGALLFQVIRRPGKKFSQRQPNGAGGWVWNLNGVRRVLYRLPELLAGSGVAFIPEGEKHVDALMARDLAATCNPGGAGKWRDEYSEFLRGRDVIILPDNDDAGNKHAQRIAQSLAGIAARIRMLPLPRLAPKGDILDWFEEDGSTEELQQLAAATKDWSPEEAGSVKAEQTDASKGLRLVAFDDIKLSAQRRCLVKGLIPRVGLVVVWGPPKSGKSFWVFDLVMHIALGWEYRGRRVQPAPVIYCAFEGQAGFEARVEAFRQRFLQDYREPVPFYLEPVTLDLIKDHKKLIALIRATLGESTPGVLVLDTLNRSLTGSESSDEDMAAYIRAADAIRSAFECAVIIVHHCGIAGTRPRGHTSLGGANDAQIAVKRDAAHNIIATVEWMKDGAEGDSIASVLEVLTVGQDEDGEDITSCVLLPVSEAEAKHATKGVWPRKLRPVHQAIMDALVKHGIGHQIGDTKVRAVALEAARERHKQTYISTGDGDRKDAERAAWNRNFKKARDLDLIRAEVIGGEELIWLAEPFIVLPIPPDGPDGHGHP